MQIIPAIDLIDGKCVRLSQGDYDRKTVYYDNPLDIAKSFEDIGIQKLHLVDLDGAKAKQVMNYQVLEQIAKNTLLEIEFGGGIKSEEELRKVFDYGANQAIIGTIAVQAPDLFFQWLSKYSSEKIILGADVNQEMLAINGWMKTSNINIFHFLEAYLQYGIKHVICTDISKDGMLKGTAVELYENLIQRFPELNIIASGGVSSLGDIEKLQSIGCQSVIVGKAIYEGNINLDQLKNYLNYAN